MTAPKQALKSLTFAVLPCPQSPAIKRHGEELAELWERVTSVLLRNA